MARWLSNSSERCAVTTWPTAHNLASKTEPVGTPLFAVPTSTECRFASASAGQCFGQFAWNCGQLKKQTRMSGSDQIVIDVAAGAADVAIGAGVGSRQHVVQIAIPATAAWSSAERDFQSVRTCSVSQRSAGPWHCSQSTPSNGLRPEIVESLESTLVAGEWQFKQTADS